MSNDFAIQVENLCKRYRIGVPKERPQSLFHALSGSILAPVRNYRKLRGWTHFEDNGHEQNDTIWALKDVSFEVKHGEVIGVIGRNGAGKSTLLKILSRITEPTSGRAVINGRVASLLEVGTGFHQELTGRENVYLNGTILGMRKAEVDRKFDEIIDFSGVEQFIDTQVKFYSSGMKVRLAFAVAAHLEPEILIIDEVLAVGDAEFQRKCLGKMDDIANTGRTVLFVSHNMAAIENLCHTSLLFEKGHIIARGRVNDVVRAYSTSFGTGNGMTDLSDPKIERTGSGEAHFTQISLRMPSGEVTQAIHMRDDLVVDLQLCAERRLENPEVRVNLFSAQGLLMCVFSSREMQDVAFDIETNMEKAIQLTISRISLAPGLYRLDLVLRDSFRNVIDKVEGAVVFEVLGSEMLKTNRKSTGNFLVHFDSNWK